MSLRARVSSRRASHVCAHRTLQRVPLNTRYTFKQSSIFNGVGINCSYVAMCTCRCVHRTIKRSCDAIYEACCTGSKCCAQMLHEVQSNCRHKCCTQVLRSCANMSCLPFCAHYHETRTKRTSHVCAHRTVQRVPMNTRYTFKQSSMLNGVGINCSYVHFACVRASNAATSTFEHSIYF